VSGEMHSGVEAESEVARVLEGFVNSLSSSLGGISERTVFGLVVKVAFYKVLERRYSLPRLTPLYKNGVVASWDEYVSRLGEYFRVAVETTQGFQAVFEGDPVGGSGGREAVEEMDRLIEFLDGIRLEEMSDVLGLVYEKLIPKEERHVLGQFYTPRPIANLIVKWAVRGPGDKVLDPGCGSGVFLVEAYKRLAELKLGETHGRVKAVPDEIHKQILSQLYGVDIDEASARLTAVNLAMRNVGVADPPLNVFVEDYFAVVPGSRRLLPYRAVGTSGVRQVDAVFEGFDAVVGNPPYTRWAEIPEDTQRRMWRSLGKTALEYGIAPSMLGGEGGGMHIFWVVYSTRFLREGGRLGAIISDSWLQTSHGVGFFRFLLDHYKVHAVVDFSARVFQAPLVGACIILLEKASSQEEREGNKVLFIYVDVAQCVNVDEILDLIHKAEAELAPGGELFVTLSSGGEARVRAYVQRELMGCTNRAIGLFFNADAVLDKLRQSPLMVEISSFFDVFHGNTGWAVWGRRHHVTRGIGGIGFFYLSEDKADRYGIPGEFLHPLIPSSRHAKYFTFTREDWEEIRRDGGKCYLFTCSKPRSELPPQVLEYIQLGEGSDAKIRTRKRWKAGGLPVSESFASCIRREHREVFTDWYDLGGVVNAPVFVVRRAQYWIRFMLAEFPCAVDDDIFSLIPRSGVELTGLELKALLAYLNSSFTQVQAEVMGRIVSGVALLEVDYGLFKKLLVPDVRRLPRGDVEKLAGLFDKLEAEARRLGGANIVENVFGSELARVLTGKNNIKPGVEGLFNTVIKEIDFEVARMLGLDGLADAVRAVTLELVKRRLARGKTRRTAHRDQGVAGGD
jgi:type I restriction-modification system DNA methylase subunit